MFERLFRLLQGGEIKMSTQVDYRRWGCCEAIVSPFNMEQILRACPALLAEWQEHPFIFDITEGRVVVKHIEVANGDAATGGPADA